MVNKVEFIKVTIGGFIFTVNGQEFEFSHTPPASPVSPPLSADSAKRIEDIFNFLETLFEENNLDADISPAFQIGRTNGIRLFQHFFHDEFLAYFRRQAKTFIAAPHGRCTYFALMRYITRAKTRVELNAPDIQPYVADLKAIFRDEKILAQDDAMKQFFPVQKEFNISFSGFSSDHLYMLFSINGEAIPFAKKTFSATISSEMVHDICLTLHTAIKNNEDIKVYVQKWGAISVYRILEIIAFDDTLLYFKEVAKNCLKNRKIIYPRLLAKEYGFSTLCDNVKITSCILDELELMLPEAKEYLLDSNDIELTNENEWKLYCLEYNQLHCYKLDFRPLSQQKTLQEEVRAFLLTLLQVKDYNVAYIACVYKYLMISICHLNAIPKSILNLRAVDVLQLQAALIRSPKKYAESTISGALNYASLFFRYTSVAKNHDCKNPFSKLKLPTNAQMRNPTTPVTSTTLQSILNNFQQLPRYVQLAFLILCETGARADEVCLLKTSNVYIDASGKPVIKIQLSKNYKQRIKAHKPTIVLHEISLDLYHLIMEYIELYQESRDNHQTDFIFIYPRRYRIDSKRAVHYLNCDTLNSHLYHFLDTKKTNERCTMRQLRARVSEAFFEEGYTPAQVSSVLGNSPSVAAVHYNAMSPKTESKMYQNLYQELFAHLDDATLSTESTTKSHVREELYGACTNPDKNCTRLNNCEMCPNRTICKEKANAHRTKPNA